MRLRTFLLTLSPLLLTSCAWLSEPAEPFIVVKTEYVYNELATQPRPEAVSLNDVRFMVVSDENIEQFLEEIKRPTGETVFIAIRIRDYENLSLNVAELKRYIQQQKNLIIYYEDVINQNNKNIKE